MSAEQNKEIVRRFLRMVDTGDTSRVEEVVTPNWVNHDPSLPPMRGYEGARQLITLLHTAFPDARQTVETIIAEGDMVAIHFAFRGTNQGQFLDLAPTGKPVNVTGTGIFRLVDGKLTDNWINFDALGLLQQIGVIPTTERWAA